MTKIKTYRKNIYNPIEKCIMKQYGKNLNNYNIIGAKSIVVKYVKGL